MIKAYLFPAEIRPLPEKGVKGRRAAFFIMAAAPFFFGLFAVLLGQDANWDLRNYHWYNAYAFLNGRYGFDLLPSQTPYFYNPLLDVPYYLLVANFSAKTAAFVLGTVQGLNFVLLFIIAHVSLMIFNPPRRVFVAALLAFLGMMGGGGIAQIGTTFYDNVTSLGVFLSMLLVIAKFDLLAKGDVKKAVLYSAFSGIPAGIMMGLKLPSVIFCVGLCFSLLFVTGSARRRFFISFAFGVGVLAGLALSFGYWACFLNTNFGSPMFPYFNNFFQSPLAPLTSARDTQFIPDSVTEKLFFPFLFAVNPLRVGEIPWRDFRLPVLYGLLPLALVLRMVFGRNEAREGRLIEPFAARYLFWFAVISYFAWLLMFSIYRYAVPLEMIAPLLIVAAVRMLPVREKTGNLLATFALVFIAVTVQPGNWTRNEKWLDGVAEVQYPEIKKPENVMIIMAGFEPYSHLISAFPPAIPFVRVQSNFASPNENKGINAKIVEKIYSHKGRYMILVPSYQNEMADDAIGHFGLAILPQTCGKVIDALYDAKLNLCEVERVKK